jgi:hypothetical protein
MIVKIGEGSLHNMAAVNNVFYMRKEIMPRFGMSGRIIDYFSGPEIVSKN